MTDLESVARIGVICKEIHDLVRQIVTQEKSVKPERRYYYIDSNIQALRRIQSDMKRILAGNDHLQTSWDDLVAENEDSRYFIER